MKKTVRTIAIYLFAAVLAVFCLFTTAAQSFLTHRRGHAMLKHFFHHLYQSALGSLAALFAHFAEYIK